MRPLAAVRPSPLSHPHPQLSTCAAAANNKLLHFQLDARSFNSQMDAREEGLQVQKAGVCCKTISIIITFFTTIWAKLKHTGFSFSDETETDPSENHAKLKQEMNKIMYQIGVNANFGLLAVKSEKLEGVDQVIIAANAMGCALIYCGLLHRKTSPRFAAIAERIGVGIIFVAIHLLVSKHLLWWLQIFLAICCAASITPLLMPPVALKINHNEVPSPTHSS